MKRAFRTTVLTLMALVSFAMMTAAQTSPRSFTGISISNFGQMTDTLYRGAQPTQSDYKALAAFGINTIVDLRSDHESYAKSAAEAAGLKYYLIPMDGVSAPSNEDVAEFLKIVNDPASGKVYFHCKAGIHRTGTMGAVYRINHDGWDYDKAYTEMTNYKFSAGLFHGGLKKFVEQYAGEMASERAAAPAKAPVVEPVAAPITTTVAAVKEKGPAASVISLSTAPVTTKVSVRTTDLIAAAKSPLIAKTTSATKKTSTSKKTLRTKTARIRKHTATLLARR